MKIKLYKYEEMLFELLSSSLNKKKANASLFENITSLEWQKCYHLAQKQGVLALAWDGVVSLSENTRPPFDIYIKWAADVAEYEERYTRYCSTIAELTDFYASHGILTMQMKGVGMSTYYPVPEHREGGDIDIFTRSADTLLMSDEEANILADKLIKQQGIEVKRTSYKHSVFRYKGIPVENHKCYLNVQSVKMSVPIEKELKKVDDPVEVSVLNGKYKINIPNDEFNTLFVSCHAMQHIGSGLCLHHLCDWACILNKCGMKIPDTLNDRHYVRLLSMFNAFAARFLGCSVTSNCSEKDLDMFFHVIMRRRTIRKIESRNPLVLLAEKTSRFYHYAFLRKKMLGESISVRMIKSIIYHIGNPKTLFSN